MRHPGGNDDGADLDPLGEADETNPVKRCREMVARVRRDGARISLTVYPGVHHNFDVALLTPGVRYRGFWLEYNEAAAKDAEEKTRAFLATNLGSSTAAKAGAR